MTTSDIRWWERAACDQPDVDAGWWDVIGPKVITVGNIWAIARCADCPVLVQCHDEAIRQQPKGVIRAGTPYDDCGRLIRIEAAA